MRITALSLLGIVAFCTLLAACGGKSTPLQSGKEQGKFIVALNSPLHYFATRLVGEDIEVHMPVPAGEDPAQWQPTIEMVLQLQQAELILLNGAGYSPWLNKVSLSDSRLVNTSWAARDEWIKLQGQVTHSHGPEGDHAHGEYAFTTWMDMHLAQVQAEAVAAALRVLWPEKRAQIDHKLSALVADLQTLDRGYASAVSGLRKHSLVYSHPVYQYFERRYKLPGISLHWEPDLLPDENQWHELEDIDAETMRFIWEAEPSPDIAQRMREKGVESIVVNPAANIAGDDWLAVQQKNIANLSAAE